MSNSLNPDQTRHYVGPNLCPKCLSRVSADDTSTQRVNHLFSGYNIRCFSMDIWYHTLCIKHISKNQMAILKSILAIKI